MSSKRYTDEFKIEAAKQVTERGFSVGEVARRLCVATHSLHAWKDKFGGSEIAQRVAQEQNAEVRRLQAQVRRLAEERDILKKAAAYFARG